MNIKQETSSLLILEQGAFISYLISIVFLIGGISTVILGKGSSNALLIGIVLAVLGAIVMIFAKSYTVTIDKTSSIMTILAAGLLGKKKQDIPLAQIKEVSLEETVTHQVTTNAPPRTQMNFILVFYLQDGTGIPFSIGSSSTTMNGFSIGMFTGRNKNIELGNKIASFLGVPFVDRRPPTLQQAITGVVEAIQNKKPMNETPSMSNNIPQQTSQNPQTPPPQPSSS